MDPFLPYLAGFFDGEGSIGIYRNGRAVSGGRTLRVQLTQTATRAGTQLLEECQVRWGGSLCLMNREMKRTAYNWQASSGAGIRVLRDLRPWLRLKVEQADIVLEWWEGRPTVRPRNSQGRVLPFAPEVAARDHAAELAVKAVKHEGLDPSGVFGVTLTP